MIYRGLVGGYTMLYLTWSQLIIEDVKLYITKSNYAVRTIRRARITYEGYGNTKYLNSFERYWWW